MSIDNDLQFAQNAKRCAGANGQSKEIAKTNDAHSSTAPVRRKPIGFLIIGLFARISSAVAPSIAARWLDRIFMTPREYNQPEREKQWMVGSQVSRMQFGQTCSLPLYAWGNGPTILLVHGLSGRASQMGAFVQPLLNEGYRVVAFDAPAHGLADGNQTALPEMAVAVQKVADHVGPLEGIIAHSNGAAATSIALSNSTKTKRVIYVSPPEDLGGYLQRLAGLLGFSTQVARLTQMRLETRSGMMFESARGAALAPTINVPALIFHDEGDRMVPFEEGRKLADLWPEAVFIATQGLGHSRILRDEQVIGTATQFLLQTSNNSSRQTEISLAQNQSMRASARLISTEARSISDGWE